MNAAYGRTCCSKYALTFKTKVLLNSF